MYRPMAPCRVCGADVRPEELHPVQAGGGCVQCNGSPACTRCGHTRRQHRGTFGGGAPGCTVRMAGAGLAIGTCGCPGYTTSRSAYGEDPAAVDVAEPRLRRPGEPGAVEPPPAPSVRDLFDVDARLRDGREPPGVPWRPPG
jgi:hypothetical protein